jgi:DNA-binding MarR family transcriptional regulator
MAERCAPRHTPEGEALYDLVLEIAATYFRLRAAGKSVGAVTPWGGGTLGLLRSLKREGPQTVPQLARARPVARQRIQKLADELAADGLVEFVDNPAHKRSKLLRLTAKGVAAYDDLAERMLTICDDLAGDLADAELRGAAETLRRLRGKL